MFKKLFTRLIFFIILLIIKYKELNRFKITKINLKFNINQKNFFNIMNYMFNIY